MAISESRSLPYLRNLCACPVGLANRIGVVKILIFLRKEIMMEDLKEKKDVA